VRAAEFDDIIANALHGSNGNIHIVDDGRHQAGHPDEGSVDDDDIERGGGDDDDGSSNGDEKDDDSLSASEISGESEISTVEKEEKERHHLYYNEEEERHHQYYITPPLVNDDESTIDMRPPAPHNQSVSSYVNQLNRQQRSKSRLIKIGVIGMLVAVTVGVILAVITLTGGEKESDNIATSDRNLPPRDNIALDFAEITASPSAKPTEPVVPLNTYHAIELGFDDVPDDYSPSEEDRGSIIGYLKELLSQDLEKNDFVLVDAVYAYFRRRLSLSSTDFRSHDNRRLRSVTIPIVFTVRGPSNVNEMLVRTLLIETIESRKRNILAYLRQYDWETFQSVSIVANSVILEDLTRPPSFAPSRPQTLTQSESPSQHPQSPPTLTPSSSPVGKTEKGVEEEEDDNGTFLPPPPPQESPIRDDGEGEDESDDDNEGDETHIEVQVDTLKPSRKPTPAPTEKKTKKPTKYPTQYPTTAKPSREPTPYPTFRPTPFPISTSRPTVRATSRPTRRPTPRPTPRPVTPRPVIPAATNDDYYCAAVSWTANWNVLLDFGNCDAPCPSQQHTACSGGFQCHRSLNCKDNNSRSG